MGKSRTNKHGQTREQQLSHENQRLKKTISTLRKQLARLDLDRYTQVREIIEEHYAADQVEEGKLILEKMKQEWACKAPGCNGYLEIFTYSKVGSVHYYRICSNAPMCKNRTKSQKYSPEVKGIVKGSE